MDFTLPVKAMRPKRASNTASSKCRFSFFCLFSFQLATLGACQCRGKKQEPCACARAAVDAKRDIAKLKHEVIKF